MCHFELLIPLPSGSDGVLTGSDEAWIGSEGVLIY